MIISHSKRFVFFCAPKTGSESLRAMLLDQNEEDVARDYRVRTTAHPFYPHMSPIEAKVIFFDRGWPWDEYQRYSMVRNPYPKLYSLYSMICRVERTWYWRPKISLAAPSFSNWLHHSKTSGEGGGGRHHQRWRRFGTWSAYNWGHAPTGEPLLSGFLRLEHFEDDFRAIAAQIGLETRAALPRLNKGSNTDWRVSYSESDVAFVADRYAWDLKNFNYRAG
jgi:hypothetical protein